MKQVDNITVAELKEMSEKMYDPLVKAVVDLERKLIVVDAEMHVDEGQMKASGYTKMAKLEENDE